MFCIEGSGFLFGNVSFFEFLGKDFDIVEA